MANAEDLVINLKAVMDVSDIKANVGQIQNALGKLKLPDTLKGNFSKIFGDLDSELSKVQSKLQNGMNKKADFGGLEKSIEKVSEYFTQLNSQIDKIDNKDLRNSLNLDIEPIRKANQEIQNLTKQIDSKISTAGIEKVNQVFDELFNKVTKSKALGSFQEAFKAGDINEAKDALQSLILNLQSFGNVSDSAKDKIKGMAAAFSEGDAEKFKTSLTELKEETKELDNVNFNKFLSGVENLKDSFDKLKNSDIGNIRTQIEQIGVNIQNLSDSELQKLVTAFGNVKTTAEKASNDVKQFGNNALEAARNQMNLNEQVGQLTSRAAHFTSLINGVQLFKKAVREAWNEVKALDKAMTETAVVTNFSVGDMWDKLPEYTDVANKYGSSIEDAYKVMTIFYQQGLETNQVFEIGAQTMQMARIAGLDYADAADKMTNALRGFNMELNETSAERVNDVYSKLAAISASDTNELATAMTKVASLANSANMEFENTAGFLAQMIETTRESAETAGTALKTVVARFAEVKGLYSEGDLIGNVEGEEVDINKVGTALRAAGIDLNEFMTGAKGLDDILLELSGKWDSLDLLTQRYIATMAAGSRQQSRFLALMSDNARLTELTGAAYNAQGASADQFAKTQESLETKVNKLKNAWDEFVMGLANAGVFKGIINVLTSVLTHINNILDGFEKLGAVGKFGRMASSIAILVTAFFGLKKAVEGTIVKIAKLTGTFNAESAAALKAGAATKAAFGGATKIFQGLINLLQKTNLALTKMSVQNNIAKGWNELKASARGLGEAFSTFIKGDSSVALKNIMSLNGMVARSKGIVDATEVFDEAAVKSKLLNGELQHVSLTLKNADKSFAGSISIIKSGVSTFGIYNDGIKQTILTEEEFIGLQALLGKASSASVHPLIMQDLLTKTLGIDSGIAKIIVNGLTEEIDEEGRAALETAGLIRLLDKETGKINFKSLQGLFKGEAKIGQGLIKTVTGAFSKIGALIGAEGAAAGALFVAGVVAALAGLAIAIKEAYDLSPGQKLEKDIANQKAEIDRLNESIKKTTEEIEKCSSAWETITDSKLDSMIEGTLEWYQELEKVNEAARQIIDTLGLAYGTGYTINENTGAYEINKDAYESAMTKKAKQQSLSETALMMDQANLNYNKQIKNIRDKNDVNTFSSLESSTQRQRLFESDEDYQKRRHDMELDQRMAQTSLQSQYASLYASKGTSVSDGEIKKAIGTVVAEEFIKDYSNGDSIKSFSEQFLDSTGSGIGKYGMFSEGEYNALMSTSFDNLSKSKKTSKADLKQLLATINDENINFTDKANKNTLEIDGQTYEVKRKKGKKDGDNVITWAQANQLALNKASSSYAANSIANNNNLKIATKELAGNRELAEIINGNIGAALDKVDYNKLSKEFQGIYSKAQFESAKQAIKNQRTRVAENINNTSGIVRLDTTNANLDWKTVQKDMELITASEKALGQEGSKALAEIALGLDAVEGKEGIVLNNNEEFFKSLEQTGLTAEDFRNTVESIDFNDPINGAKQLKQLLKEGGDSAVAASLISGASEGSSKFFGEANQIKTALQETTKDGSLQSQLYEIVKAEGKITTDNLEELTKNYANLKTILDQDVVSETAFANIMTAVGKQEISLNQITDDLVESISLMSKSFDLAADSMKRLKDIEIGDDLTEIGKTLNESADQIQDYIKRGAVNNSQIDDLATQLLGDPTWTYLMDQAGGDREKAYEAAKSTYGLDKIDGNLYGPWKTLVGNLDSSSDDVNEQLLSKVFGIDSSGKISYNTEGTNTSEIIEAMANLWFHGDTDTAGMYLGDLNTYSSGFEQSLQEADRQAGIKKFLTDNYDVNSKTVVASTEQWNLLSQNDRDYQKAINNGIYYDDKGNKYTRNDEGKWIDSNEEEVTNEVSAGIEEGFNTIQGYQNYLNATTTLTDGSNTVGLETAYAGGLVRKDKDGNIILAGAAADLEGKTNVSQREQNYKDQVATLKDQKVDALTVNGKSKEQHQEDLNKLNGWKSTEETRATRYGKISAYAQGLTKKDEGFDEAVEKAKQQYLEGSDTYKKYNDEIAKHTAAVKEIEGKEEKNEQIDQQLSQAKEDYIKGYQEQYAQILNSTDLTAEEKNSAIDQLKKSAQAKNGLEGEEQITADDLYTSFSDAIAQSSLASDEMAQSVYLGVVNGFATLVSNGLFADQFESEEAADEFAVGVQSAATINTTTIVNAEGESTTVTSQASTESTPLEVDFNTDESGSKTAGGGGGGGGTGTAYNKGNDSSNGTNSGGGGGGGGGGSDKDSTMDKMLSALEQGGVWTSPMQLALITKQMELLRKSHKLDKDRTEVEKEYLENLREEGKQVTDLIDKWKEGKGELSDIGDILETLNPFSEKNGGIEGAIQSYKDTFIASPEEMQEMKDNFFAPSDEYYEYASQYDELGDKRDQLLMDQVDKGVEMMNTGIEAAGQLAQSFIKMFEALAQSAIDGINSFLDWLVIRIDDEHDIEELDTALTNRKKLLDWEFDKLAEKDFGYSQGKNANSQKDLFENIDDAAQNILIRIQNQRRLYENSFRQLEDLGTNINTDIETGLEDLYEALYGKEGVFTKVNDEVQYLENRFEKTLGANLTRIRQWDPLKRVEEFFGQANFLGQIEDALNPINKLFDNSTIDKFFRKTFEQIAGLELTEYRVGDIGESLIEKIGNFFHELSPRFDADYQIVNKSELTDALNQKMQTIITNDTITAQFVQNYLDYLTEIESQMEDEVGNIRSAEEAILDLYDEMIEIMDKGKEQYGDLEQRIYDAVVGQKSDLLEKLQALNDNITEADADIVDALRKNIEAVRAQRENDKTETDLSQKEKRLAYLKQDTSDGNLQEIMKLEEELKNGQQSYTDKLIDDKITELEDQNQFAADQRQTQIDLLQAEIDNTKGIWSTVNGLMDAISGYDSWDDVLMGEIKQEAYNNIINQLKAGDDYKDASELAQKDMVNEWGVLIRNASVYGTMLKDEYKEEYSSLKAMKDVLDQDTKLLKDHAADGGWHNYVSFNNLETAVRENTQSVKDAVAVINNIVDARTLSFDETGSIFKKATVSGAEIQTMSGMESAIKAFVNDMASELPGILTQVTEGFGNIMKGSLKGAGAIADTMAGAMTLDLAIGDIGEGFGMLMEGIEGLFSAGVDGVSLMCDIIGDTSPGITDMGVAAATLVSNWLDNAFEEVDEHLQENVGYIMDQMFGEDIDGQRIGGSFTDMGNIISEKREAMKKHFRKTVDSKGSKDIFVDNLFDSLEKIYEDIGYNVQYGLENNDIEGYNKQYARFLALEKMMEQIGYTDSVGTERSPSIQNIEHWAGEIGSLFEELSERERKLVVASLNDAIKPVAIDENKLTIWDSDLKVKEKDLKYFMDIYKLFLDNTHYSVDMIDEAIGALGRVFYDEHEDEYTNPSAQLVIEKLKDLEPKRARQEVEFEDSIWDRFTDSVEEKWGEFGNLLLRIIGKSESVTEGVAGEVTGIAGILQNISNAVGGILSKLFHNNIGDSIEEWWAGVKGNTKNVLNTLGITTYATGGAIGYNQTALVGEAGAELIQHAGGGATLATGPQMAKLKKGDIVYNAKQTKQIMKGGKGLTFDRFAEGTVGNFMMRDPLDGAYLPMSYNLSLTRGSQNTGEYTTNINLNLDNLMVDSVDRVEEVADAVFSRINEVAANSTWPYNTLN